MTTKQIGPKPENSMQIKAVEILRDRNHPSKSIYTEKEIQWAVEIVREWEPDHPFLRYSERKKPVSKPGK